MSLPRTHRPWHSVRQRGAALIEMNWVLWLALLPLTMILIHNGLLFFAKNQLNHATFMAARAGTVNNADPAAMRKALIDALVPMFGGGLDDTELQASRDKAAAAVALTETDILSTMVPPNKVITVLNPSRESFDDWADASLSVAGKRVIPNSGLEYRGTEVRASSKQNIQDANILRIRVVMAYRPKVPLVMFAYREVLNFQREFMPDKVDPLFAAMIDGGGAAEGFGGYIPIVSYATLQMQSDPMEF